MYKQQLAQPVPAGRALSVQCRARLHVNAAYFKQKKSLGQNYLANKDLLNGIVNAAKLAPNQAVIEIGPGRGLLTKCLVDQQANITAVEKDRRLIESLTKEFPQVNVIEADILTFDLEGLLKDLVQATGQRVKIVANLPFYVTQDFLRQVLPLGQHVSNAILLLQEETALRLTQLEPGAFDYRAANIETQLYSKAERLFVVPKQDFMPVPNCNGMVVDFKLHLPEQLAVADAKSFLAMVRQAFSSRRKMLYNNLQASFSQPQITHALSAAGLDPFVRPQALSFQEFVRLFQALQA